MDEAQKESWMKNKTFWLVAIIVLIIILSALLMKTERQAEPPVPQESLSSQEKIMIEQRLGLPNQLSPKEKENIENVLGSPSPLSEEEKTIIEERLED